MIIPNGTIEPVTAMGGGINAGTGHAQTPTLIYGTPIPCQYLMNRDLQGRVEGEAATKPGFTIYICNYNAFASEKVRLKNISGADLGTFSIKSSEPLDAVGQIKLTI